MTRVSTKLVGLAYAGVVLGGFLLVSMGGAILAAPATVPACWVVMRRPASRAGWRVAASIVFALTLTEMAWAATYLAVGEAKPAIWLVPAATAAATLAMATTLSLRPAAPSR